MSAAKPIIERRFKEGKKKHPFPGASLSLGLEVRRSDAFGEIEPVAIGDGLVEFPPPLGGAYAVALLGAFAAEEMLFDEFDHVAFLLVSGRLVTAVLPVLEAHYYRREKRGCNPFSFESVSKTAYSGFFAFSPAKSDVLPCFFNSS